MGASTWSKSMGLGAGCFTSLALAGCPQLLDDNFSSENTTAATDGGDVPPAGGAGGVAEAGSGGAGAPAAGGASGAAGVGGGSRPDPLALASVRDALKHRYSFEGTGTTAVDAVGGADGLLYNASLEGDGFLDLLGAGEFVNLPNGLLSSSDDKTIECWLTWRGGNAWQRIFDFGVSDEGEAARGVGMKYLFLTPRAASGALTAAYSQGGEGAETRVVGTSALPTGSLSHVAVVIDSAAHELSLYVNGDLDATQTLEERLSDIDDVNSWLGMAQYSVDPFLNAQLDEFRIYERALTAEEIRLTYRLGPDEL